MNANVKYWIGGILLALVLGFFVGRATTPAKEIIRYVAGTPIQGNVPPLIIGAPIEFPAPVTDIPLVFWKRDTVYKDSLVYVIADLDTAKVIQDFILRRDYKFTAFNDEVNGKLDIMQTVQFNKLQDFNYIFTPIHKETTIVQERVFTPFISATYNTFGIAGVGGGLFYHNVGVEYNYLYDSRFNTTGHGFGVKIKF